jgi:hypothetical protein
MYTHKGDCRPDFICIVSQLLMALGEEKAMLLHEARADLVAKLKGGLNPIFYRDVPFLPLYIAAGSTVQFGVVMPNGEVSRKSAI